MGANEFNQDLYVPDSVGRNFVYVLRNCNNFKSTLSVPINDVSVGIPAKNTTLGATVVRRDTGRVSVVEFSEGNGQYYWNDL